MNQTSIGWTDFSANLLKYRNEAGVTVWGCVHASDGCTHCYAESLAKRWGRGEAFTAQNMKKLTPFFDQSEANQILKSKKIAGKKVFVDDMTDLFGEWVDDEIIDQHFALFALRSDVTFQVLTKRAKRMRDWFTQEESPNFFPCTRVEKLAGEMLRNSDADLYLDTRWPLPNVHVGVSVEDQKNANERIGLLVEVDVAVRWASIEPLLSPLSLRWAQWEPFKKVGVTNQYDGMRRLDGIVIGGESGPGHREMPLESALTLAREAKEAGVAVYFKQDSGPRPGMQGRVPDDVWAMKEWAA